MLKSILFLLIFFFNLSSDSYAYIDPISGGFILQTVIAVLSAILTFIIVQYKKIKILIKKIFKKKIDKKF